VLAGSGITIVKSNGTYTFSVMQSAGISIDVVDKGTINTGTVTFTASAGSKQKLTVGGPLTIAFTGWPVPGIYGEIEIQLVNAGVGVTWPTVNWLVGNGASNTTFSAMGVTLVGSGSNWVVVWTTDGGTSIYGRAA